MIGKRTVKWFMLGTLLLLAPRVRAQTGQAVNVVDGPTGRKAYVTTNHALTMHCDNCSSSGGDGLTNTELRATPVPVSGDFTSDGLTNTELRLAPVVVQVSSGTVAISSVAGTVLVDGSAHAQPVTGVFYQATQPVSIAGSVAVTGTFFQATQPVSGPLTDAQLRATPVPVSGTVTATGPLTDTQLRASAVPISASALPLPSGAATDRATAAAPGAVRLSDGSAFYKATTPSDTQPISASSLPLPTDAATQTTLALIKAKTDNLDVALSTRTKPADSQTVTGSVTATQATGSNLHVAVDSAPTTTVTGTVAATQSGTWTVQPGNTANTTAWKVDGSAVTQPISGTVTVTDGAGALNVIVDSSALPSGAATAAKQPALGTAGTASADVITVQGKSGMTALVVDGSGVTQPVSGTVTVTDGAGALNVIVDSSALPSGAATAAKQPALGTAGTASADVLTVQGKSGMTALVVDGSGVTQPVSNSGLSNLDVALSTRLKPADTLTAVTTVGTITNPVTVTDGSGALNVIVDSGTVNTADATVATSVQLIDDSIIAQNTAIGTTKQVLNGTSTTTANPTYVTGTVNPPSSDTRGNIRVTQVDSGVKTYHASGSFTVAATATDVVKICGAAATVVKVWRVQIGATQTTATSLAAWTLVKRSADDTTGTFVAATKVPMDATDAAAGATVGHYTANPGALGAAVGTVWNQFYMLPAPATAINPPVVINYNPSDRDLPFIKPVTLNAAAQCLAVNLGGGALPAGLSAMKYDITWSEQ
jgi:hypothetical protein